MCSMLDGLMLTYAFSERDGHQRSHQRHERKQNVEPCCHASRRLRLRHVDARDTRSDGHGPHPEGPDALPL